MLGDATLLGMANRFTVKIDNGEWDLGSWSQIEGLDVKWDIAEYRAGDSGNERWYFPGNTHYSMIRMTRAASTESAKVRDWLDKTSFNWAPQTAHIKLHDSSGTPIVPWELKKIMPVKWSISSFDASASRVATETLELNHMGFLADEKRL
jgi:phage tail-like protein